MPTALVAIATLSRRQRAIQPFDLDTARLNEDCRFHAIHLRIILSEVTGQCSSTGIPASRPLPVYQPSVSLVDSTHLGSRLAEYPYWGYNLWDASTYGP